MIEFVEGELVQKNPASAIVLVGGMAFELVIPASTYEALPAQGAKVRMLTHLYVRENEVKLFGFSKAEERQLFRMLQDVNRVGPMLALKVLSSCPVGDFRDYIMNGDAKALSAMVKGIGEKTARRLIVELGSVVDEIGADRDRLQGVSHARDVVAALVQLGSKRRAAQKAVKKAVEELGSNAERDALFKAAMQQVK